MDFEIWFPCHPPSTNSLFSSAKGRRFKTKEYRLWDGLVYASLLRDGRLHELRARKPVPYRFTIELHANNWIAGTGNFLRKDAGNYAKAAQDAICAVTGWKDEYCVEERAIKVLDLSSPDYRCRLLFESLSQWP